MFIYALRMPMYLYWSLCLRMCMNASVCVCVCLHAMCVKANLIMSVSHGVEHSCQPHVVSVLSFMPTCP